jgi:hypothetical protein
LKCHRNRPPKIFPNVLHSLSQAARLGEVGRYRAARVGNAAGSADSWRKVIMRKSGEHLRTYRERS